MNPTLITSIKTTVNRKAVISLQSNNLRNPEVKPA